jgi:hypothetical protein
MPLVPVSRLGKTFTIAWAVACLGVLLFAIVKKDVPDTDIVVLVLLTILCFPVSLALAYVLAGTFAVLAQVWDINVPGGLVTNAAIWVLYVVAGYAQWRLMAMAVQFFRARRSGTQ